MNRRSLLAATLGALCFASACDRDPARRQETELKSRESRLSRALARPDSGAGRDEPIARWLLPKDLKEISGLALTTDGRLLTHGDERAIVWEIDYRRGVVVKSFSLGDEPVKGDFESIAVAGDRMFLLTSKGKLYEFEEGADSAHVAYTMTDTGLRETCEIEGMAHEASTKSLLIACKTVYEPSLKDSLVIFRWKLDGEKRRGLDLPRLTVPVAAVIGAHEWTHVRPSDITVDPKSGNYVIVASKDHALIEITPAGKVVSVAELQGKHDQAEGVAITTDGILLVSDEGVLGPATLTLYRRP